MSQRESSAYYWDSQAVSLSQARMAVWSVDPAHYEATTKSCVRILVSMLPETPARILDVGCGIGRLTIPMAHLYRHATLVGIDFSPRMLDIAEREARQAGIPNERLSFMYGSAANPIPAEPFDAAYSIVVLQHLQRESASAIVANIARHLNPGGRFVFQTVDNSAIDDWGHVPPDVIAEWVADSGMQVEWQSRSLIYQDWLWTVASRP